ncbi:MAG: hypothetical protein PW789_09395 [Edaphobacter sp.]|uniref:hypothetical protein n=1 Tax=Edaphobacter sp. TaxID=1934404 RepID=UPI00238FFD7A|nr:hypothetical protein [Edaphobacter sp.]MDE1176809.1 hypothetical protein [Edaphobacter sp.]
MSLDQILVMGLYGLVFVFAIVFITQRIRWRISGRGFRPRGAMLGNALHQLQTIAEPRMQYVIEEKLDEDSEDEESGGPDDPIRHLHRQARKIKRGETVDRLTALRIPRE